MRNLIQFWKTVIPLNYKKRVYEIPDTCCHCDIKLVDFDMVKDKFTEILKIDEGHKLRSVDAIGLLKKHTLCLIEMKGHDGETDKSIFVKQKITETIPKFVDSIFILISILGYFKAKRKRYYTILHPKQLKISPYLVVNYEAKDLVPIRFALQGELNIKMSSRIQTPIQLINCEGLDEIFS